MQPTVAKVKYLALFRLHVVPVATCLNTMSLHLHKRPFNTVARMMTTLATDQESLPRRKREEVRKCMDGRYGQTDFGLRE